MASKSRHRSILCGPYASGLELAEAADTFEGIVRWRLIEEAIHQTTEETEQALAWLVAQGYLREASVGERGPLFQLNAEKRAEAERFLATREGT